MSKNIIELTQDNFSDNSLNVNNTIFVIKSDIEYHVLNAEHKIQVGSNSILEFQGGSLCLFYYVQNIKMHAILEGNNTSIHAPHYPIFIYTILGAGFNNSVIYADWFANSRNPALINDNDVINLAVLSSHGSVVELSNREYTLSESVYINEANTKINSPGTIVLQNEDNPAFIIKNHFITLNINKIKSDLVNTNNEVTDESNYKGVAVKFTGNCYHCDININQALNLNTCFDISPCKDLESSYPYDYAGVQYCRFKFQEIFAYKSINIDFVSGAFSENSDEESKDCWVTECKFSGGRLEGMYGIYYSKHSPDSSYYNESNGMVFENIGFENIEYPITMWKASFCSFTNIRMAESIYDTYIDLEKCNNLSFDIKGQICDVVENNTIRIPKEDLINCLYCNQIELRRAFVADINGWNRLNIVNSQPASLQGDDYFLVSSSMGNSIFNLNWILYDAEHPLPQDGTINFNVMMMHEIDGNIKYKTLSNVVNVILNNGSVLVVDFNNSCYWLKSMLIINLTICDNSSKLKFVDSSRQDDYFNNMELSESGVYYLSYDPYNEPVITKL